MDVTWDGWYTKKSEANKTRYMQQLRNMQITFFDHVINGSGEDHLGKYKITGDFGTHKSVKKSDGMPDDDSKSVAISEKGEPSKNSGMNMLTKAFSREEALKIQKEKSAIPEFTETAKMNFNLTYENGTVFNYEGTVMDAGTQDQDFIAGTWKNMTDKNGATGNWEFVLSSKEFKGWCSSESGPVDIWQRTTITKKGIFSIGRDDIGIFIIRGDVNVAERTIQFAKNYFKKQSLVFNGRWNLHRGEMIIRGMYDYRDLSNRKIVVPGSEGVFEMRGIFGHAKPLYAKAGELPWGE